MRGNFMRTCRLASVLLAAALLCPSIATGQTSSQTASQTASQASGVGRGVTAEDYFAFEFLSDPRVSPDGRWVAYVVTTIDQRQNRRQSNIWV
ncbi:MAG TPA: hypothetical protein VF754_01885, partial [Pyrinomonadaceae bacterium]